MEHQWQALRQSLKSKTWSCEAISNPFFRRLLIVFADQRSGPADRVKAYYDALASAHSFRVRSPSLPFVDASLVTESTTGLIKDTLTGEVLLDKEELVTLDKDVYTLHKRRFLVKPPVDAALLAKLPSEEFSTYNGRGQQTAIRVALTSPDNATLFVNLPTGCGKTLLIHALMLMRPPHRLSLVVVPTVGLALEQATRVEEILRAAGEHHGGPYAWVGGQSKEERTTLRERLKGGGQRILFCAPEAARTSLLPILFQLAKNGQLGSFIVDEAHLIDQWGAGFRPDFQLLPPLVQSLQDVSPGGIQTILMSATFSPATMEILKNIFAIPGQDAIEVNANFLRPEPSYYLTCTHSVEDYKKQVLTQLGRMPRPLILYTTKRSEAEEWYELLLQQGYSRVGLFHGDTGNAQRKQLITQWQEDRLDIMIATSAFGVGMDKGDVRSVLHATVPENIDRFYQECGRGGRDGNASMAHLIYHPGQIPVAEKLNQETLISTELGLRRWFYMQKSGETTPEGRLRVSLRTQHEDIGFDSQRNQEWNWRTLLLMKRAGFVRLFFSEPQFPKEKMLTEDQLNDFFSSYFAHVEVETIHDGHLDQHEWDGVIGKQRMRELEGRRIAFLQLKRWLDKPTTPLCQLLAEFYSTNGFFPEGACGGCPGCRSQGKFPFTPTLGTITQQPIMGCHEKGDIPRGEELRIHYSGQGKNPRVVLHKWKHLISLLLQKGKIRAIRAQPAVHQLLYSTLPSRKFWCALTPDEPQSIWDELVLVMPDEASVPPAELSEVNKIFFIPDHLQDPRYPHRSWFATNPQAISLEDFERRLSHVNN